MSGTPIEIQTHGVEQALQAAKDCFSAAWFCRRFGDELSGEGLLSGPGKQWWRMMAHAFLNRACELACVPLAQYYTESSRGDLDLTWITYRPEAVPWSVNCDPAAMVYLGSIDNLTEDQARCRAIGY